ncbi:hypothetical protein THRCLA_23104 [Thraustotheca clavata]|uniref:Uncharacterized protein n=1 Tax=Thraustotheca clavata TaxID=74557 RepID=A0A1V9YE74_9STRA|nr:hypothetical protein THRCLA_23104 [Thraustotheca clavata]
MSTHDVPSDVLEHFREWVGKILVPKASSRNEDAAYVHEEDITYEPYRICVGGMATRDFRPNRLNFSTDKNNERIESVWRG